MNNKKLFKNISLFTFFNLVNSAIPFLLLPILTSYLKPEDYGIVDIFYNISLIATPVIGLSVVQSISRFYFEDIDLPKFVTTVILVLSGLGLLFIFIALVLSIFSKGFLSTFDLPPFLIVIALIYTLFSQISEILLVLWRVSYNTVKFGVFRVLKTAMDLGLSILLIVSFHMGWQGRVLPQLIIAVLFGGIAVFLLRKQGFLIKPKIDKFYRKEALAFSIPLVFHSLGSNLIGFSDRFFILFMLGLGNVGIYSVGYQIGMILALLQNSFNQAWVPFFFQKLKEGKTSEKRRIVKITYVYFGALLIIAMIFYILTPFIYRYFIGSSFDSGMGVVFWVLLGYAFQGMYKMAVNYLFYLKKTKLIAICTLFTVLLNFALNYILIRQNGIIGAAQASLLSFVALFVIVFVIANKHYKMPWRLNSKEV